MSIFPFGASALEYLCGRGSQAISDEGDSVAADGKEIESTGMDRPAELICRQRFSNREPAIELKMDLGSDLTQLVFSKLGFQALFQTASLAKEWRDKLLCLDFQRQVESNAASSWKSYAPLYWNGNHEIVGYDNSSKALCRLPSHSFIPQNMWAGWDLRSGAGSLLCWTSKSSLDDDHPEVVTEGPFDINVSNPLTKSWRQLRRRPVMIFPESLHLFWEAGNSYKVIAGSIGSDLHSICMQVYDSITDSWIESRYHIVADYFYDLAGEAIKDGVVHMLISNYGGRTWYYKLVSFDVARKSWRELDLVKDYGTKQSCVRAILMLSWEQDSSLVVCGSRLLMVVRDRQGSEAYISVFEIKLEEGLAVEVATGPREMASKISAIKYERKGIVSIHFVAGQDGCIYIGGNNPGTSLISYNVETQKWDWVHSADPDCMTFRSSTMDKFPASFTGCLENWRWVSINYSPGINTFFRL